MGTKKAVESATVVIESMKTVSMEVWIKGITPLITNKMSQKVIHGLLLPKGKKTAGEKASTMKHNPYEEFRATAYILEDGPTFLGFPAVAVKSAMGTAALEVPGAKKTQIQRMVFILEDLIPIWGIPEVLCAVVRTADMAHTPDVRTRMIIPHWCARLHFKFPSPQMNEKAIVNLLSAGGFLCGIGEWRQEKGSGNYGSFTVTNEDDPEVQQLIKEAGRETQIKAFESPEPYNAETKELLSWFNGEAEARGFRL